MATLTKKEIINVINELNAFIEFETQIDNSPEKTNKELIDGIEEKQGTDELLIDGDFSPGSKDSLKIKTVKDLIRMKVTLPETWANRLIDAEFDEIEDYVEPAPKSKEIVKPKEKELPKAKEGVSPKKKIIKVKAAEKAPSPAIARYERMTELILEGVEKEKLAEIIAKEFEVSIGFVRAVISDCKSDARNPLAKRVVEKKMLFFVD